MYKFLCALFIGLTLSLPLHAESVPPKELLEVNKPIPCYSTEDVLTYLEEMDYKLLGIADTMINDENINILAIYVSSGLEKHIVVVIHHDNDITCLQNTGVNLIVSDILKPKRKI